MEDAVTSLLRSTLQEGDWTIRRPKDGWSDASFIAELGNLRVFVKVGALMPILRRLGEIGVAPRVLAGRTVNRTSFVVQEFVDGAYPDHPWFQGHLDGLAGLLARFHRDLRLRRLVEAMQQGPPSQLRDLEWAYGVVEQAFGDAPEIRAAYEHVTRGLPMIAEIEPVPTHGDLSRKNFVVTGARTVVIDWDDLTLTDPVRDIGPLLWWYVPEARWSAFSDWYGLPLSPYVAERIYWWAACISLDVTAGLLERGYVDLARDFLEDFVAAAGKQANPHAEYGRA